MMRFITVFITVSMILGIAQQAYAQGGAPGCSCVPASFDYRWRNADAVFVGRVEAISVIDKFKWSEADDAPVTVDIKISRRFKGTEDKNKFILHTSISKNACTGYPFEVGQDYLVYVYQRRESTFEQWSLYNFPSGTYGEGGLCGGTAKLSDAMLDINTIENRRMQERKSKKGIFD